MKIQDMVRISKQQPHLFTPEDLAKIESNARSFNNIPTAVGN
jgi:hypothetical protein